MSKDHDSTAKTINYRTLMKDGKYHAIDEGEIIPVDVPCLYVDGPKVDLASILIGEQHEAIASLTEYEWVKVSLVIE